MTEKKTTNDTPKGELLLYQTEDGRTRIECRFEGETVWLTQAMMAELFQTTPQNITQHLREIYADGELDEAATCKAYLQVRTEGSRQVSRNLHFYNIEAILAVGFRVRSHTSWHPVPQVGKRTPVGVDFPQPHESVDGLAPSGLISPCAAQNSARTANRRGEEWSVRVAASWSS